MNRKLLVALLILAVAVVVIAGIALFAGRGGQDVAQSGNGSGKTTSGASLVPVWTSTLMLWVVIISQWQAPVYPVQQSVSICHGDNRTQREQTFRSLTSLSFRQSPQYQAMLDWQAPKGPKVTQAKDGDAYLVTAAFKDGNQVVFHCVKRTKEDGRSVSAYVIDGVHGGSFYPAD